MKRIFFAAAILLGGLGAADARATADFAQEPVFTGQWDVPHLNEGSPLLFIEATDDNEVHVLNYLDQTLFEYDEEGVQGDSWEQFDCVDFSSVRNVSIDSNDNVFVLESGVANTLHRFSDDYFEEHCGDIDVLNLLNIDDESSESSEDSENSEDSEESEDDNLPDVLSFDVVDGIDVDATSGNAYVISENLLTRIELETGEVKTAPLSGAVAVSAGRPGRIHVLTDGGNTIKVFNNGMKELSSKALDVVANDLDLDKKGNIYVAQSDGMITQYSKKDAPLRSVSLPDEAVPSQVTISNDGDLFVVGKDSAMVYHYDFPNRKGPQKIAKAIHRFYSKVFKGHFFTSSYDEAIAVSDTDDNWEYEAIAYKYIDDDDPEGSTVYRFYSSEYQKHFYTSSEAEKDSLIANDPNWVFEGDAYKVYATEQPDSLPTYRFYSQAFKGHFYTTSEEEKTNLIENDPNWIYEGIAWWVVQE